MAGDRVADAASAAASTPALRVRPYVPSDNAAVVRIWRRGFLELAPYVRADMRLPVAALLLLAGAGAHFGGGAPPALALALPAALATAFYGTPAGLAFARWALSFGVASQERRDMAPSAVLEAKWARPGRSAFFVAEAPPGGPVVGCVAVIGHHALHSERASGLPPAPGEASMWRLSVEETVRRAGVGRALVAAAEGWAARAGFSRLSLITGNPESKAAYARLGYALEREADAARVLWAGAPPRGPLDGAVRSARRAMLRARLGRGNILVKEGLR